MVPTMPSGQDVKWIPRFLSCGAGSKPAARLEETIAFLWRDTALLSSCPNLREVSSLPSTTRHQPFPSELQRGAHARGLRRGSPSQCLEKAVMMRPRVPPADLRQGI